MYGPEEERVQNAQTRQGHSHYNYTRGFEGIKKEKITYVMKELFLVPIH